MFRHAGGEPVGGNRTGLWHHLRAAPALRTPGATGEAGMGSFNPPKKRDYSNKTRIDLNQSYQ
ncbi:MAG: hypothetical protein ACXWPK_20865, partial [Isosphaeraceae bacterium]